MLFQKSRYGGQEIVKALAAQAENDLNVHILVVVPHDVADPDNLFPRDMWMFLLPRTGILRLASDMISTHRSAA